MIKPLAKPSLRWYLWRLLHPRQYKAMKNIDEMYDYKIDFCPFCGQPL